MCSCYPRTHASLDLKRPVVIDDTPIPHKNTSFSSTLVIEKTLSMNLSRRAKGCDRNLRCFRIMFSHYPCQSLLLRVGVSEVVVSCRFVACSGMPGAPSCSASLVVPLRCSCLFCAESSHGHCGLCPRLCPGDAPVTCDRNRLPQCITNSVCH